MKLTIWWVSKGLTNYSGSCKVPVRITDKAPQTINTNRYKPCGSVDQFTITKSSQLHCAFDTRSWQNKNSIKAFDAKELQGIPSQFTPASTEWSQYEVGAVERHSNKEESLQEQDKPLNKTGPVPGPNLESRTAVTSAMCKIRSILWNQEWTKDKY